MYNGEKYLRRCLDSIVNQSFGIDKLALVLLSDGSTDSSQQIAESYAAKFPKSVKVFSHPNMGAARTRNRGISLVKTKYMMFVDQDDFLDVDYCKNFYEAAEKTGADVVAGGYRRTNAEKVFYTRHAADTAWYPFIHMEAWAKIHRTDFVKKAKAEFFNNVFGEDIPFTVEEIVAHAKFTVIDYVGYNWFTNESSITQTIHKDFSNLNLPNLLNKLSSLSNSPLTDYHIIVVALYAFMVSNARSDKPKFRQNLEAVFGWLEKAVPDFSNNQFIKRRVDGCPTKTYMAVRLMIGCYKKSRFGWLYLLYRTQGRRISRK
jgi:glycosyltransferase involved in cell wall biosynthesis